jgi:protein-L-isoaspartate(D-aspartate) O-methyltransferase
MNLEQARNNMIQQQIRPWEVFDQGVLDLLDVVRREEFTPTAYRTLAFADMEIPLGHGASMLAPRIEARALQTLKIRKTDKVLEIGTGSGYMAALLAAHAGHVHSVEIVAELADAARATLKHQGIGNVAVVTGDAAQGWVAQAPYDAIMVSGGMPLLPQTLLNQLKIGGRLLAFVGEAPIMEVQFVTRTAEKTFKCVSLFETAVPQLANTQQPARFSF